MDDTQKTIAFNRSHGLAVGLGASAGISHPHSAQRNQIAAFGAYHVNLTRKLGADLAYSPAGNFYPNDRDDFTNVMSLNLKYRFNECSEANLFFSYGNNASSQGVFDYTVWTVGAGGGLALRF